MFLRNHRKTITDLICICNTLIDVIKTIIDRNEQTAICGCWFCPDHDLIIEKIGGKFQATIELPFGYNVYPIEEEKGKLYMLVDEKHIPVIYSPNRDSLEIDTSYYRKSTYLADINTPPTITEIF